VTTRGVIYVHAAPAALTPHIEWAVAAVLDPVDESGAPLSTGGSADEPERGFGAAFEWTAQPAEPGTQRAEVAWEGPAGTASRIASALRGWPKLRFEVTEETSVHADGERYAWTPKLGMFRATIGHHGDIQVGEDRIRAAVARAVAEDVELLDVIDELLGHPWDEELEPFRYAGDGAPVRVLHHVV
jgi:hypothetical protein